jgi:hypothetical protein
LALLLVAGQSDRQRRASVNAIPLSGRELPCHPGIVLKGSRGHLPDNDLLTARDQDPCRLQRIEIRRRTPGPLLFPHTLGHTGDELVLLDSQQPPYRLAQQPLSDDQLLDRLGAFEDVEDLQCSLEQ